MDKDTFANVRVTETVGPTRDILLTLACLLLVLIISVNITDTLEVISQPTLIICMLSTTNIILRP